MSEQLIETPGVFGENGNFLLEREIGRGGMGGVYLGRDKMLDRTVAVKVMLKEFGSDAEFVEKFKKEAQAVAKLIHPNIAQIYSYGISDGMPYIAMELASGGSLYSLMNATPGKTDIQRTLKICQQVAQALQCSSDHGYVHGDVKPENILLDANGNAKLVDFGLAAMQKDTEEIWGTPYYIAPEKIKKETPDFRADMYSLGGTLYHALTGVAPFEGNDSVAVVKKRFESTPRKPSEIRPEISSAIDALVMKMLSFDRNDRFPSFESLIQSFKDVLASGLTQNLPASSETPVSDNQSPAPGGRKVVIRNGRRVVVRRAGATTAATGVTGAKRVARPGRTRVENVTPEEEDEESGGSLGAKVALFVVGGIAIVAAIAFALVWYVNHTKEVERLRIETNRKNKIAEAVSSIKKTREASIAMNDDLQLSAGKIVAECEKFNKRISEKFPGASESFRPPLSKALLDAIASTNAAPAVAPAVEPAAAPTAADDAPAAPLKTKKLSLKDRAKAVGLSVPEVADQADPEYQDFLAALKKAEEEAAKAPPAKSEAKTDEPEKAEVPEKSEYEKKIESLVTDSLGDIHEIWNRAYECQAEAIYINTSVEELVKECDAAIAMCSNNTEEVFNNIVKLAETTTRSFDDIKNSKRVENLRKGVSLIKQKGLSMITRITNALKKLKLDEDRRIQKIEAEKAEKERLAKIAAERAALVENECTKIKERFVAIVAHGCFRQLDWESAYRMLKDTASSFKTPEGEIAAKAAAKTVDMMKSVQDIFIKNAKGHVFRGALKGCKIVEINEKDIMVLKMPSKQKQRIQWQKFYAEYPGNLNELINHFIVKGRQNSKLNLKDWADAMLGSALTMKLVCPEVNGALKRAEQLAKEVILQYPDYLKPVKVAFPEISVDQAAQEEF